MKIYFTRHGQVLPAEFIGSVDFPKGDIPLSEKGKLQAACLGEALEYPWWTTGVDSIADITDRVKPSRFHSSWRPIPYHEESHRQTLFFIPARGMQEK